MQNLAEEVNSRDDSTVSVDEGEAEENKDIAQESVSTIQSSSSPPSSKKSSYSQSWWAAEEGPCRLQKFTELGVE